METSPCSIESSLRSVLDLDTETPFSKISSITKVAPPPGQNSPHPDAQAIQFATACLVPLPPTSTLSPPSSEEFIVMSCSFPWFATLHLPHCCTLPRLLMVRGLRRLGALRCPLPHVTGCSCLQGSSFHFTLPAIAPPLGGISGALALHGKEWCIFAVPYSGSYAHGNSSVIWTTPTFAVVEFARAATPGRLSLGPGP